MSRGKNAKMDKDEQNAYNEPMKPNSPRHKQLMKVRANLMAVLSETKIPFVMFESDAIWLQNPMEFFAKQQTVLDDANIILSLNSIKGQQRLGANLIIAFANNGTRRLLQELRRQLNQDENLLDQEVIINQLCHSQFGGVLCRQFSLLDISDGIWLRLSDGERLARRWPLIVHNNFYTQIEDKMARQAINGFWFLSPKNSCNLSKAQRILEKYNKISQKSGG
uniref:Nucleotid_trans domain-containing protein n=1 Tax=Globodera pallida TaxID=36090 RepID=A0A183CPE4_GLOPA